MAESGNPYWYQGQSSGSAVSSTSYGVPGVSMNCAWRSALMRNPGATQWSKEEQTTLERGLVEYAGYPVFLRNLNISVDLPTKTVREVALRLRWMEKRSGMCMKDQGNIQIPSTEKMDIMEELSLDETVLPGKELVENEQIFAQVSSNLASFQIHENVNLLAIAWDNINKIRDWSTKMDKVMGRMPPMPAMIDENLLKFILKK